MQLIDKWKEAGKLWSIQAAILFLVLNLVMSLLSLYEVHINATLYATLNAFGGALIAILRVLTQGSDENTGPS